MEFGRYFLLVTVVVLFTSSCSKKIKTLNLSSSAEVEEMIITRSDKRERCDCNDPNNYAPNPDYPLFEDIKYIKVNFHYPNSSDKANNYTGEDAVLYSTGLISHANGKLKKNQKMNLPEGNVTPVYDTGYRYKLVEDASTDSGLAIYEDVDDELWSFIRKGRNTNNYNRAIIRKFEKKGILNIFGMAYHPDSLKNPKFKSGRAGIALGTSLKIAGIHKHGVKSSWRTAALMNHEVGHIFGLRHSWYKNDGCDDTPPNPNCWGSTDTGKCKGVISNNMMDYNNLQMAITPCQIGVVKKKMHKITSNVRKVVEKDWCEYNPEKSLIINEDTNIDRSIDMKGDIIVEGSATLRLSCRIHMPNGGKIIVHPEATLILNGCQIHNDCNTTWGGFDILKDGDNQGKIHFLGKVKISNLKDDLISKDKGK